MTTATTTDAKTPRPGLDGQTFLVGDLVYIRAVDPADAEFGTAIAATVFPKSTHWLENWIKEELPKSERSGYYVVVRKGDDQPVGRLTTHRWEQVTQLHTWIDPLLGDQGQRYLAEAMRLIAPWLVDEQHRANLRVWLTGDQTLAAAALEDVGAREVARFPEMFRVWGGRADGVVYEYLNRQWIERLGDPAEIELPRAGTGDPRPVQPPVLPDGDPPANAVRLGARVYLRPLTKADYEQDAFWSLRDPETFWDAGRWPASAIAWVGIEERGQKEERPSWVRFAVCLRESDEVIGALGLSDIDYLHGHAETESAIFRAEYRGGGYGSEAKQLLLDYAFNTLNLHSLQSFVIFPNTRSAAALRKQGYQEVGRAHWSFSSFGTWENFVVFNLLAADWRALPRVAPGERDEERGA
jgi:RimJ/RimL family protein N-acetyltransferase